MPLISLNDYGFSDPLITVDTNIWLYCFKPNWYPALRSECQKYIDFMDECLVKNIGIILFHSTFSELLHQWIHLHWSQFKQQKYAIAKKSYRQNGRLGGQDIYLLQHLLDKYKPALRIIPNDLSQLTETAVYQQARLADPNDLYLYHECLQRKIPLVAHDADFERLSPSIAILRA